MVYDGATVYQFTTTTIGPRRSSAWIAENVGTQPLPGGAWSCEFSFGAAHTGASFRSGGPTGAVVDTAVCAASDSILYGSNHSLRVCKSDESGTPIAPTDRIVCAAVFVKAGGKDQIELISGGANAGRPFPFIARAPLWVAWATFAPLDPAPDGAFAPGSYTCRFSSNGASVDTPFTVSG